MADPIGEPFLLDYGDDDSISLWQYADDYAFWRTAPQKIPEPPADFKAKCENVGSFGPGTCLDGRIWLHAETDLGQDADHQTTSDGVRVGFHDDELANHFIDVAPDRPFAFAYGGLRARPLFFLDFTLPFPPPVWREWTGAALPVVRDGGSLFAVFTDGHREEADFRVGSSSLRAKLFDPTYRWAQQTEASPYAGGRTAPELLALSADGTSLLTTVVRDAEGLHEEAPVGCPSLGDACFPPASALQAATTSARKPPPRSGFIPVYSRVAGRLFVVGGRETSTGAVSDELWTYRLEDGEWDKLDLRGSVGEIEAATFSWRDGSLWMIARDAADRSPRRTRLLRLEPTTGVMETLASTTAQGPAAKYDWRGFFLDVDGNVGLFASSDRAQKHRIARLSQRPGGYDVRITYRRDRALSAPPIVDDRGVALYYEPDRPPDDRSKDGADDPVRGDRTSAASRMRRLPLRPARAADLEDLLR